MLAALLAVAVLSDVSRADALIARGEFDAALRLARSAEPAASEEIRGAVAEARDSLREAADHYEVALRLAEHSGNPELMADAAEGLMRMYGQQGRTDLCLALANQMAEKDPAHRALYVFERGVAYSSLNDSEPAWQAFEESLHLAEASGDLKLIAQIRRHRGLWIWRYERDLPRTLHEYDLALMFARRAQAWRVVVLTLINYGNPLRNRDVNRLPEALQRYQEGLAIARREHLSYQIAYILKNIGDVYRQQGDSKAAEAALTEALRIADEGNVQDIRWMARNELGMLLRNSDPTRAERSFRDALRILEAEQSDMLLADFRPGALADSVRFFNPYDQLIDLLVSEHRPNEAFLVAEGQRARAFLATLSASRAPAVSTKAEMQIVDRIKTAQALLRTQTLTDDKRADLVASVGRYESALSDLRLKLAVEHPSLAHARFPKLWTVGELQSKLLAGDEALLSLYLGADRSVAWIVTRERASTISLPPAKEIEGSVRAALQALRNPGSAGGAELAALSRVLQIDAIAKLAGKPRLVIVPDGALNDLPFEVLVSASGHPLIERYAIAYAPSASSLAFLRSMSHPPDSGLTLMAIANPMVGDNSAAPRRQVDLAHMNLLAPVPQSGGEAREIAKLFGSSALVLEGGRATRSQLIAEGMDRARILHFATHGLIDETRPDRSGLVLTADPPRDDGLLQVRDIFSLRLNADLVTLSACETALGQNVTGEGILGLTRAFFFAGARSVVASLWDVDDASTSRFMQRFYANLRRGEAIDLALQHAKLDIIRDGKPPFDWAAFVVSGNARASIPAPPERHLGVAGATVGIVAIAAIYLLMIRVRRGDVMIGRP